MTVKPTSYAADDGTSFTLVFQRSAHRNMPVPSTPGDVRMRGFSQRTTVGAAIAWIDQELSKFTINLRGETVPLSASSGRVLASDVVSDVDVPLFARSMMDGYAVRSANMLGAAPYNRLPLEVVGESMPGRTPSTVVASGQSVRIMTGAPLPVGADAVLPAERTEVDGEIVYTLDELSPDKHVGRRGEDELHGTTVLPAGCRLRPQDLGALSSTPA